MSALSTSPPYDLTEREIEILELLNEGLKNKEIASRTGLTLYTVKWYLKQIYGKLYVSNRTQAATKARELGLLAEEVKRSTRTMAAIRTNLPETITPFYGRQAELAQIKQYLLQDGVRLVTLHGIGGMGKTRLALELGHQVLKLFADGVYFIPLASEQTNPLLAAVDALAIGSGGDPITQLSGALYNKHLLLIFDNFEHLLSYAAALQAVLQNTQQLHVLVTSREVLSLRGEHVITLDGLDTQDDTTPVAETAAYQLYQERARINAFDFVPDDTEKHTIQKLCRLVGGMPLAIEMAAGWSSVMSVTETFQRLSDSLDLLESDAHDRPERHHSIRATFDYSLNLLPAELQRALITLGIFHREGFTLQAAEHVAGISPADIKQLMQAALLQRGDHGRFTFHPLIYQYISALLQRDADHLADARQAHGEFYLQFSQQLVDRLYGDVRLTVVDELRAAGGNLLLAWHYAVQRGYYDWLLVAIETGYITEMAGLWDESMRLYSQTLQAVPMSEHLLRGRILAVQTIFAYRLYDLEQLAEYALAAHDLLAGTRYAWEARSAMSFYAVTHVIRGQAERCFELLDAIDEMDLSNADPPNAYIQSVDQMARPVALLFAGRYAEALPLLEDADVPMWVETIFHLPECYLLLGMNEQAHQVLVHQFTSALDSRNHRIANITSFYLGMLDHGQHDIPTAILNNFIELTRMGFRYPVIVRNSHYYATLLHLRGHVDWAQLLWRSGVHLLHALEESAMMYQYLMLTAQSLLRFEYDGVAPILMALARDDRAPATIREQARQAVSGLAPLPQHAPHSALEALDEVLLGEE